MTRTRQISFLLCNKGRYTLTPSAFALAEDALFHNLKRPGTEQNRKQIPYPDTKTLKGGSDAHPQHKT